MYEDLYCARGEMENRIKEQQIALFADRTSNPGAAPNQLRLYFSSFAYVLIETLRALGLGGTELAQAQCDTIRLKLLKIGAQIRITVRNIWIAFSEALSLREPLPRGAGSSAADSFALLVTTVGLFSPLVPAT